MRYFLALFITFCYWSCDQPVVLPDGTGKSGEVMVVIPQQGWEGLSGAAIRDVLQAEQSGLPQSEPLFSLIRVPPQGFDGTFKRVRNVVIIENSDSAAMIIKQNVWASDQVVIMLRGRSQEELKAIILNGKSKIRETLYQNDFRKIRQSLDKRGDAKRQAEIEQAIGLDIAIPTDYKLVENDGDFVWLKQSFQKTENGQQYDVTKSIWIHREPFTGPEQLNRVALTERRNRISAKYIEGPSDSSYMQLLPGFPHEYNEYDLNGKRIYELRGLWNMHNARMGGPYITYSFVSPDQKFLYTLDGFVFAPSTEKRDYIRELEAIMSSAQYSL